MNDDIFDCVKYSLLQRSTVIRLLKQTKLKESTKMNKNTIIKELEKSVENIENYMEKEGMLVEGTTDSLYHRLNTIKGQIASFKTKLEEPEVDLSTGATPVILTVGKTQVATKFLKDLLAVEITKDDEGNVKFLELIFRNQPEGILCYDVSDAHYDNLMHFWALA